MVASELPIPELAPLVDGETRAEPDVRVELDKAGARPADDLTFSVSDGECRFSALKAGAFVVRGGRQIVIRPDPLARPAILRSLLLGSAWGALLHQRGAFALHAGITARDRGAFAFCGPPAAGKSSTVSFLVRRGHTLVSDDLSRLEVPEAGPPQVWPSTARLKLSHETVEAAGWSTGGRRPELHDEKVHLRWEGAMADGPLPLRAVYVLRWGQPRLRRLRGIEAVRQFLAAATYRPKLLETPADLARHWQVCVEIARRVPIWELSRLRDWSSMQQVMESLSLSPSPVDR